MRQFQSCYVSLVQLKTGWPLLKNLLWQYKNFMQLPALICQLFSCVLKTDQKEQNHREKWSFLQACILHIYYLYHYDLRRPKQQFRLYGFNKDHQKISVSRVSKCSCKKTMAFSHKSSSAILHVRNHTWFMSNLHTFQGLRRMRRAPFNPIPTTLLGYRMTSFGQTKQQNHLTLGKNW